MCIIGEIMMRPDVIAYYKIKNLEIPKLIERRPLGVTAAQVEAAAVAVFDSILSENIELKDRDIARHVWTVARQINGDEYEKDWQLIRNAHVIISQKDAKFSRLLLLSSILAGLAIVHLVLIAIGGIFG